MVAPQATPLQTTQSDSRLDTSGGLLLFAFTALLLIPFWILWFSGYVVHQSYVSSSIRDTVHRVEIWWSWFVLAGILWGTLNLYWAIQSLRRLSLRPFLGHWVLMIGCGLAVLGIEAAVVARAFTLTPIIIDHSKVSTSLANATAVLNPAIATDGDAGKGKVIFSKTCITCHGPSGQGMPNLAPSLVGSAFIKAADNSMVSQVIRLGRALGDPSNKSGKVMPARGCNPFLTDEDIAHLVAFVRSIQSNPTSTSVDTTPAAQLAAWVVPLAKRPENGFDAHVMNQEMVGGTRRTLYTANHYSEHMRWLCILLTTVHSVMVMGVVTISSHAVLPRLLSSNNTIHPGLIRLSLAGWTILTSTWILIAWICFWWS